MGEICRRKEVLNNCRDASQSHPLQFSFLAITFDVGHQMTRRLHHSKALVEAHLFRGVSGQSEHFPEIRFSAKNGLATEVESSGSYLKGVYFYGIVPEHEKTVSIIHNHILSGSFESLEDEGYNLIIGDILAYQLGLNIGWKDHHSV